MAPSPLLVNPDNTVMIPYSLSKYKGGGKKAKNPRRLVPKTQHDFQPTVQIAALVVNHWIWASWKI